MANFFEGVGKALMHPIDEAKWMFDTTKDVLKGDMKLKDVPGSHQDLMNDITVPILGDNKLAKNSDAVAGAVIGGVLAAPAVMGAMGGSAGGASSAFSLGDVGKYFKPGKLGSASDPVGNVSGWNKFTGKLGEWMDFGEKDIGKLYGDVDFDDPANDDILGMISETEDEIAKTKKDDKMDFDKMAKVLRSVQSNLDDNSPNFTSSRTGGGFRYDKSLYENPLIAREYQDMYMSPLYKKLK